MKFLLEKNQDVGHRVTINIPKIIIDTALLKEFTKINKKTNINGFRKGKVPIKIIQQKYGNNIYYDVFNKLMQKFFFEFLKKNKINTIGRPKYYIDEKKEENENFKYSVTYEVHPEIQIQEVKSIQVEKIIVNMTDEDIKENILKNQKKTTIWNQVNRAIKINDRITINYSIYENNKKIDKFDANNIQFVVLKNHFLDELNNKIINHYVNDVIFFKIFFSSFHPEKDLNKKNITFKIKIIKVEEELEIDKENHNFKYVETNLKTIKNQIIQDINQLTQNHLKNQIIHKLIKQNPIKIPPILLKEKILSLHKKLIEKYQSNTQNILDKRYHVDLKLTAKKKICTKLILEKIIQDNHISVDEQTIENTIKQISLKYKKPSEIIQIYNKNKILRNTIKNFELEKEVIKFLQNKIKIINKHYTLNEFIHYNFMRMEELYL